MTVNYPQYPSYPPPAGQVYPPQQYPAYPQMPAQQGFPPQPAPTQPLATGSLDEFYNQPSSGGGAALKFDQIGTRYVGIVTRPVNNGDIQQQTDVHGRPQTFKDGRPKFVMKVPLQMQPTQLYPDGLAQWYVKGQARDELVRAMAEAGAPEGPPEQGAIIDVTFVSQRPSGAGMNPAKLFQVRYTRPDGPQQPAAQQAPVAPSPAPAPYPPQATVPAPPPPASYTEIPATPQPAQSQPYPLQQQIAVPGQPLPPIPAQAYPPMTDPTLPPVQFPSDMSPEQQALLAKLTNAAPAQNG